jgi:threonine aldolase
LNYETAAPALLSGVQLLPIEGQHGVITAEHIKKYLRPKAYYFPQNTLICLENTHNRAGGFIYPVEEIRKIRELALNEGIRMHLDGARIYNASVETGIPVDEYASYFDSISFCFSKGLGAPVGTILCSTAETIEKAHRFRKIIGGGMRQAGILAAAAMYALDNNIERLKEDHKKARYFAESISKLKSIDIDLTTAHTNIIIFRIRKLDAEITQFRSKMKSRGVLFSDGSFGSIRAVFHLDVSMDDVKEAVNIFASLID